MNGCGTNTVQTQNQIKERWLKLGSVKEGNGVDWRRSDAVKKLKESNGLGCYWGQAWLLQFMDVTFELRIKWLEGTKHEKEMWGMCTSGRRTRNGHGAEIEFWRLQKGLECPQHYE